jgi:hypothetical protein
LRSLPIQTLQFTRLSTETLTDSLKPIATIATTTNADNVHSVDHTEQEMIEIVKTPRLWRDDGWTAKVIKNEDDEGWAVAMIKDGEPEPALVGPWTMGRDKKNPKPLDAFAFSTLVKTASEFVTRHEQQRHATLHQSIAVSANDGERVTVSLDIVPDDDEPYAILSAHDDRGDELAQVRVAASFKLTRASAMAWVDNGYARPES